MASLRGHEINMLANYLPPNCAEEVIDFMHSYKIHLKIKRERKRILGDYRPAHNGKPHTISLNATLNSYHFLITFLHELAHLITYLNHSGQVKSHGTEWKKVFGILLQKFIAKKIFPHDIEHALLYSIQNMGASTCSEPHLFKVLRQYDEGINNTLLVEEIGIGNYFKTNDKRHFKVIEKRRTRFLCEEVNTKKRFLFPAIYEVETLIVN